MKQLWTVVVGWLGLVVCAQGHAAQANEITDSFKGLVIVSSKDRIQKEGRPGITGVKIEGPSILTAEEVERVIKPYLGKPLTEATLKKIQIEILRLCRKKGHWIVDAFYPNNQYVEGGVPQMMVVEAKLGKVTVDNPGKKWTADETIRSMLGVTEGQPIDMASLQQGLRRLNGNVEFREVQAAYQQGSELGATDLAVAVADRFPLRPHAGVENEGTTLLGEYRMNAGLTWGNAFWAGHTLDYTYTSDIDWEFYDSHSLTYSIPLSWGHSLGLLGTYAEFTPDYERIGFPGLTADGQYYQGSLRYNAPLPKSRRMQHRLFAGYDFRRTDNQLLFGTVNPVQDQKVDVSQFVAGYSAEVRDRLGTTTLGLSGIVSPGGMTDYNDPFTYESIRTDTTPDYFYINLGADRKTPLVGGFTWVISTRVLLTPQRLTYSEQMAIGGMSTVRGYEERVALGDNGYVLRNELLTKEFGLGRLFGHPATLQLLGFLDHAEVTTIDALASEEPHTTLTSAGAGLRLTLKNHFALAFDYGFQLVSDSYIRGLPGASDDRGRAHLFVDLKF
jgi:hemolysin activation/secretion protein